MVQPLNILVVEDRQADFLLLERHLRQEGILADCRRVDSLAGLKQALEGDGWDLVLTDYSVPTLNFMESFDHIRSRCPELPIILVSGSVGEEQAVELLKLGVWDFVLKDNLTRLATAIASSVKKSEETRAKLAAEEAMRASENRFRSIFNNSPIAIGIGCREDGRLVEVNAAWLRLYGYERDAAIGRTTAELQLYLDDGEREEIIGIVKEHGHILNREVRQRRKSGEVIVVQYSAELIELGGETHLQAMITDITEQKRIELELRNNEAALRESERFSAQVINNADEGIIIYGTDLRYRGWNPYMEHMVGLSAQEVIGKHPLELFPILQDTAVMNRIERILAGQPVSFSEFPFHSPYNGYSGWASDISSPLKNEAGEIIGVIAMVRDVTARKQAEEAHRNLEEQLRQSQKMEAVGQLAGGIAHDFNNIMQVIVGNAQLQAMFNQDHGVDSQCLEEIFHAVERGSSLTRSLLVFSRRHPLEVSCFDLNTLLRESRKLASRLVTEDIGLSFELYEGDLPVTGDAGLVQQMLFNLVTNAKDAIAGPGSITVSTDLVTVEPCLMKAGRITLPQGEYALFAVVDTGCGIDEEIQEKVFEPFFTTKEIGKGTGLGLSMIHGTVSRLGGGITIDSTVGAGTIFSIYLPLSGQAVEAAQAEDGKAGHHLHGKGELILITEDDRGVRDCLAKNLELFGYRIMKAANAGEALALAREQATEVRLALLDIVLPGMNGSETLAELRAICPGLPALFLSGYSEEVLKSKGISEYHLRKPVHPVHLLKQVRRVLDETTPR